MRSAPPRCTAESGVAGWVAMRQVELEKPTEQAGRLARASRWRYRPVIAVSRQAGLAAGRPARAAAEHVAQSAADRAANRPARHHAGEAQPGPEQVLGTRGLARGLGVVGRHVARRNAALQRHPVACVPAVEAGQRVAQIDLVVGEVGIGPRQPARHRAL